MALGPFTTYVPPGVYTRTLTEANAANLVAGLRIPVYIGVGQEELDQTDLELVRGSSAQLDQQIVNEDVSQQFVVDETNPSNPVLGAATGAISKFRVRNFPIVDGQGFGRNATSARSVSVTINGTQVAIGSVQGAKGYVTLQVPAQPGDDVRCTYFFHRSDTAFTDTVSSQVSAELAVLTSPAVSPFEIVAGSNVLALTVNGASATISLVPGTYTAAALKSIIDAASIANLATSVFTDNQGRDRLRFTTTQALVFGSGSANGALGFAAGTTTNRNRDFKVFQRPIVDGTDGGITTTDPSKVTVMVNNVQVLAEAVDGTNGVVTLPIAPAPGSKVTIAYFANTWQDTFDYLPNTLVTQVTRAGFAPGRSDYFENDDFVVSNPSPDVSIIHWGSSFVTKSTLRSPGATVFDGTQIIPSLVDDRLYLIECERVVNTSVIPALPNPREFTLPEVPTTGNGRDTPLGSDVFSAVTNSRVGLNTNRPDLVQVYAGYDVQDALSRPKLTVRTVDSTTRVLTLKETVPPDQKLFATFWFSRLRDDTYVFTNKVPGAVGSGQFEVFSVLEGKNLYQTRFGTKSSLPETVQWPRGVEQVPDAYHAGSGTPVSEIVTITFASGTAQNAVFTNSGAAPWQFFPSTSNQWRTVLNGSTIVTNLNTAVRGFLVSDKVTLSGGNITISAGQNDDLELTIDGTNVSVTLTAGSRTPSQIVTDINTAIDAAGAFSGTAPNNLASTISVAGKAVFVVKSFSVPAALPGGFDHASMVSVRQGTAEHTLGLAAFQSASGTPTATNKPATMLGSEVGPFNIQANVSDTLEIRVDGIDYTISLPTGATVATSSLVTAINGVPGLSGVASAGTLGNLNKLRLMSPTRNETSGITILGGNANDVLGFNEDDSVGATAVEAQEVVNELLATSGFVAAGVAYVSSIEGSDYVTIESNLTGATSSSVAFLSGSASAFNESTGTGIVPGTSGDNGENASDVFTVSSNSGSGSGGTGVPGQTYTDERTGLRFTILPSLVGSYSSGGSFTMNVNPTFVVHPARPWLNIGGLEIVVTDTVGIGVDDTATVQTFDPHGLEPAIGDYYFVSYKFQKTDFSTRLFQQLKTIVNNFGPVSAENRVTLASYLAIQNGAVLVGIKQVLKVPNTNQANDATVIQAISDLATPLQGNIKPDILVPLASSLPIYQYLLQHCEVQSGIRNQAERMGFIGFSSGTSPTTAQAIARGLVSNRIIAVYPDSAVVTLTNENGEPFETLVDGTFLAAGAAGAVVSPSIDVATPYTRRTVLGFTRLVRNMDPVEKNQTATAGITMLEDLGSIIRIRQGLTTDMSSILTRLPTVTQIADFVQQQSRVVLDSFVGTKFLSSRSNEVEVSMTGLFRSLVQAEIVGAFTGIAASVDPDDPTILLFESYYQPIFPLLYLVLTFNLRARL